MKMLNSIGSSIGLQGTPLLTCLQLGFVPLVTPSCAHSFGQFLIYLTFHLSNLYFVSLSTKVKVNNMAWSPVTHKTSHPTVEGNELGQARFPLCKSMQTTPDHLLVLHGFGNAFQEDFPLPSQGLR